MELSRKKSVAIIALLMIASVTMMANFASIPVEAQLATTQPTSGAIPSGVSPNFTVQTVAYISVRPTVVGVGQTFLVNLFPVPAPNANRKFPNLKVTITKPDNTQDIITMDSYVADGTAWFEYVASQLGTWKFKLDFPGVYYPAGRYLDGNIITATSGGSTYAISEYYQPSSSKEMTLTVQQDWVASWPEMPLPTDYWTRPVPYAYREWAQISGDFPWRGPSGGALWDKLYPDTNPRWGGYQISGMGGPWRGHFTPWVQGPNSAHVAWKRQYGIGGIVGGDMGLGIADTSIFSGSGVSRYPFIVYGGRAYMSLTYDSYAGKDESKPGTGKTAVPYWQCFDYRTGELIWERPLEAGESPPNVIEYFNQGLLPGGQVSITSDELTAVNFLSIGNGYLRKYDPWTGAMVANISIAPMTGTGGTYFMNGYVLGVQDLGANVSASQRYRLVNWTTFGTTTNFTARVQSNITWPWNSLSDFTDYSAGISVRTAKSFAAGAPNKTNVMAASLATGQQLWSVALDEWEYSSSTNYADHGKFAMLSEQGYFIALDLNTGSVAWKSEKFDYPWDEPGFGGYNVLSAYGLLYRNAYTGIYAFNWKDGKLAWKYTSPAGSPYETPYVDANGTTVYSTNIGGAIADGKYYIYNTEHSATVPITRGWQLHAINATTGEGIWKVAIPGGGSKHTTDIGPIADGYLSLGGSDGYMYVFGKGKSAITVTAPNVVMSKGNGIVITGTVVDLSPAQPNTPAVSKESMALQMEHIHQQMPIDGIWHNQTIIGVPVKLTAIAADGSVVDIGTVTTNGYYGTFGKEWVPPNEGTYQIIANFAGDESYGSSAAATTISVGPALATPDNQQQPQVAVPDYTMTIIAGVVAVIIALAIVGIVLYRKK
ncbi:MAG TPA: PQQ-binding-like beta-propeller repeat protein [Candidatus Sulfotelmatobacter sp.]|nr:PQQ-binding-like beta-propeller repeat protein [Candidatus Sulfotelmatobacter sp.]